MIEATFALFEKNCAKQDWPRVHSPELGRDIETYEGYKLRCNYAEKFFMVMRLELKKYINELMEKRNNLKYNEAPVWQVAKIDGKIEAIQEILGIQSSGESAI